MYPNQLVPERTNAIPCQYKRINFRSLLEARWAYFFDKLGWTWQYEPFEMDGYIPDFLVKINGKDKIIDVKPKRDMCSEKYKLSVYEKCKDYNLDVLFCLFPEAIKIETMDFYVLGEEWTYLNNAPYKGLSCLRYWYNDNVFLENHVTISDHLIYCINQSKPFKTSAMTLKDIGWLDTLIIDYSGNIEIAYFDEISNLTISQQNNLKFIEKLKHYWAEAQNATQYKPKTPQQFIDQKNDTTKQSEIKLLNAEKLPQDKVINLNNNYDYLTLWEKVLDKLEPPTTRTLLRQHGSLFNIKGQNIYLKLSTEQLLKMARLRLPNIKQAFDDVLGYSVQVHLQTDEITVTKDVDNTSIVSVKTTPVKEENNNNQEDNYYDQVKKLLQDYNLKQKYIKAICCRVGIVVKIKEKYTPTSLLREHLFNLFENDPQKVITVVLQNFRELLEDNTNIVPVETASVKEENNKNQENNCYNQVKELVQPTNKHNLTYDCLDNLVKYPLDYIEKTLYNLPRRKLRCIASALKINQRRNRVEISKSVMLNEIFDIYRKTPKTVINAVHEKFPNLLLGETK